jgi:hypothetical protein
MRRGLVGTGRMPGRDHPGLSLIGWIVTRRADSEEMDDSTGFLERSVSLAVAPFLFIRDRRAASAVLPDQDPRDLARLFALALLSGAGLGRLPRFYYWR